MLVRLRNGIVLLTTARSLMRAAIAWIRSDVSNTMLPGGTGNVGSVGFALWHDAQRAMMISWARAKVISPDTVAAGAACRRVTTIMPPRPMPAIANAGRSHALPA